MEAIFPQGERLTPNRAKVIRETLVDITEAETDLLLTMFKNRKLALT